MKKIKIFMRGCPADYQFGLLISTIKHLDYQVSFVKPQDADLIIYGSFYDVHKRMRWAPKLLRQKLASTERYLKTKLSKRIYPPLTLFHTAENLRHNHVSADYSISFDIGIDRSKHFRLPYWMEIIDWSHEGIVGNKNPRYGNLLNLERLVTPLGNDFLCRQNQAVLFSSHLREPRKSILDNLKNQIKIDLYGPVFDHNIKDHHSSNFKKIDILKNYSFNLCPENSLYPGYVTEKIPESFHSGCLPISWVDTNVKIDFNPDAFINLAPLTCDDFEPIYSQFSNIKNFAKYSDQSLLKEKPSIANFVIFIKKIVENATS